MRFLIVASFADSLFAFRGHLIDSLVDSGAEVHVAAPDLLQNAECLAEIARRKVTGHNVSMTRAGRKPIEDLMHSVALFKLVREVRPDAMLVYTIKPVIYGVLCGWLARVPRRYALITGLGYVFTGTQRNTLARLVGRMYRAALSRSTKVFFQNRDDELLLRQSGILPASVPAVVVNGSGVDVDCFRPVPFPQGGMKFLMIARLLGNKGVREYVSAATLVKAQYPDTTFALVGWIDENPDSISKTELEKWVTEGTIEFLGRLDDVRPAISDCSVYVLPSYREGTPRTVLEAMAMGRPVITSDAPGCRDTVVDGENGFLVPVKSVERLAAAMIRFIEVPLLIEDFGRASRKMAEEKYDVRNVSAVMMDEMGVAMRSEAIG